MQRSSTILVGVIALAIIGGGVFLFQRSRAPAPLDGFASCLREKHVTMYGASWCPHCKRQKEMFGRSFRKARYVECSLPGNPQGQAPACRDAKIDGYPTWVFGDGSRVAGVLELDDLAQRSGCALPANTP